MKALWIVKKGKVVESSIGVFRNSSFKDARNFLKAEIDRVAVSPEKVKRIVTERTFKTPKDMQLCVRERLEDSILSWLEVDLILGTG